MGEVTEYERNDSNYTYESNARSGGEGTIPTICALILFLAGAYLSWRTLVGTPLIVGVGSTVLASFLLYTSLKVANQWNEAVVLRLGKFNRVQGPGIFFIIPFVEAIRWINKRTQVMDVTPQEIMTSDSVPVEVDAVVYFKVNGSKNAILNVEDFDDATSKLAQTTLRDIVGRKDLTYLLKQKEDMGKEIKDRLDKETGKWGIDVENVEIKDVILPDMLKRAMAKEAEAIREKNARVIKAEGELAASKKLKEASSILDDKAITLRQLQTWQEIGTEKNTMMIVVPSDLIIGLSKKAK